MSVPALDINHVAMTQKSDDLHKNFININRESIGMLLANNHDVEVIDKFQLYYSTWWRHTNYHNSLGIFAIFLGLA